MEAQVLVLNSGYMPVNIVSWQDAICDVISGRAVVEDVYEGLFLNSPSKTFPLPSIIRFVTKMAGMFRRGVKFNRKNIWLRDQETCQYCGHGVSLSNFTFDHVVPKKMGGRTTWENIVVACHPCNQRKEGRTPEQAKMKLISKPYKPKALAGGGWSPGFGWRTGMPESWRDYLKSSHYWNDEIGQ